MYIIIINLRIVYIFVFQAELKIMEDIRVQQQAKEDVTKKCLNIKEESIEQIEPPKIVEKVRYTIL